MSRVDTHVLPADKIVGIRDALVKVAAAKELCRKGEACGYDCSGQSAVADALESRLQAVLSEFGPYRTPDA